MSNPPATLAFCNPVALPPYVSVSATSASSSSSSFITRRPPLSAARRLTRAVAPNDASSVAAVPPSSDGDVAVNRHSSPAASQAIDTAVSSSSPTSTNNITTASSTTAHITEENAVVNISNSNGTATIADVTTSSDFEFTFDEISQLVDVVQNADLADFRVQHEGFSVEITRPGGLGFDAEGRLNPQPQPIAVPANVVPQQEFTEYYNEPQVISATSSSSVVSDGIDQASASTDAENNKIQSEDLDDPDQIYDTDFVVTSNRVGFFFSGAKNKPPLVNVGDNVAYNQPVCIIEQLGQQYVYLSEAAGKVVKLFVEDGDAVEYGSTIMVIRPD